MSDTAKDFKNNRRNRNAIGPVTSESFWKRIQKPVDCWLYDGAKEINGYGYLRNPFGETPKYTTAHRIAWIFTHGPIPEGLRVLHKCDVRSCVNPAHLFLGTDSDNTADKLHKGRFHSKLTPDEVREIRRLLPTVPQKELAKRFKISITQISSINCGRRWSHVK